jgi:hypothetical protein
LGAELEESVVTDTCLSTGLIAGVNRVQFGQGERLGKENAITYRARSLIAQSLCSAFLRATAVQNWSVHGIFLSGVFAEVKMLLTELADQKESLQIGILFFSS